ncbi:TetR/AcrR family transcriptional regulator [Brachybacterium saurashtrense]|uniref:TetR family transcriptional regulator n=1 Tax=Brachybacterium saurashtrense TaxID=556288 RepID=A0A345YSW6_9MICO|nr:TetR/AcrR family transcriptional regulator [Brachybacterium saurashtrense]AXK47018.1 TetR family transcriptional regulator [Brachybacterium saurashtrense]RRR20867.1 TetR family transcriptional regulator [Brachybacterium saurashtrense]
MLRSEAPIAPQEAARATRSDARRAQILAAAVPLLERRGSHEVSMQSIATAAGVSVGLIYRYFAGKQELVRAVTEDVLDDITRRVAAALGPEEDPVRQIAAAFAAYCTVIRDDRQAVMLTYRESHTLDAEGRKVIKELEIRSTAPLRSAVDAAVAQGLLRPLHAELFTYDLVTVAHSWALKNWYFAPRISFEAFVTEQTALLLSAVLAPGHRDRYADLLADLAAEPSDDRTHPHR